MAYDDRNVFARILRGEIPAEKVYEDDHVLAFNDIAHLAPVHVLVIPKGPYVSLDDFAAEASDAAVAAIFRAVRHIVRELGVEESGYRVVANCGPDGGQEVPHFHHPRLRRPPARRPAPPGGRRVSGPARVRAGFVAACPLCYLHRHPGGAIRGKYYIETDTYE
jgi:diadenosine tetraphosphate (Ap4A) HIT family hydrolase